MNTEEYDNPYQLVIDYEYLMLMQDEDYPSQEEESEDELS